MAAYVGPFKPIDPHYIPVVYTVKYLLQLYCYVIFNDLEMYKLII